VVEERDNFQCKGRRGKILNLTINHLFDDEKNLVTISQDEWGVALSGTAALFIEEERKDYVQAAVENLMAKDDFYDESELMTAKECFQEIKQSLDFQMEENQEEFYIKPVHLQALVMLQNEMVWQVQKDKFSYGQNDVMAVTDKLSIDGQKAPDIIKQEKIRKQKDYTDNKADIQARYGNRHPGQIPGFDIQ